MHILHMIAFVQVWQGGEGWAMSDQLGILGWMEKDTNSTFLGVMGRFSDDGNYTKDITEGTLSNVRQIRIADFIKTVVATRRWIVDFLFCAIVDLL